MHMSPELDLSSTTLNMNTSFTSSKVWLNYLLIYIHNAVGILCQSLLL